MEAPRQIRETIVDTSVSFSNVGSLSERAVIGTRSWSRLFWRFAAQARAAARGRHGDVRECAAAGREGSIV